MIATAALVVTILSAVQAQAPAPVKLNWDSVRAGFDVRSGKLVQNALELSYNQQKEWSIWNQTVKVPDTMELHLDVEILIDLSWQWIITFQDYISFEVKANLDLIFIPFVVGWLSTELSAKIQRALELNVNAVFIGRFDAAFIGFSMYPSEFLESSPKAVQSAMQALPIPCNELCDEFFRTWGTHYTTRGSLGAEIKFIAQVSLVYIKETGRELTIRYLAIWIRVLAWRLGFNTGYNDSHAIDGLPKSFVANASMQVFFNDIEIFNYTRTWLKTQIMNNPTLVRQQRVPITDLCVESAEKCAALEGRLATYMYPNSSITSEVDPPLLIGSDRVYFPDSAAQPSTSGEEEKERPERPQHQRKKPAPEKGRVKGVDDCPLYRLYPSLPGADSVLRGWDSATMRSTGLPLSITTYTSPVSCLSYPSNKLKYKISDQNYVTEGEARCNDQGAQLIRNVQEFIEDRWEVQKHKSWLGMSREEKMSFHFLAKYYVDTQLLFWNTSCIVHYSIASSMAPGEQHPLFVRAYNNLPQTWSADNKTREWRAYNRFLKIWGTDYVRSVNMGATSTVVLYFHNCFLATLGVDFCMKLSMDTFLGLVSSFSGSAGAKAGLAVNWDLYTDVSVMLKGGDGITHKIQNLTEWENSIYLNMAPVLHDIQPITDLIDWDPVRLANLKLARQDYLQNAANVGDEYESKLAAQPPLPSPTWCPRTQQNLHVV